MRRSGLAAAVLTGASTLLMLTAPFAAATFHLVSIREVFPGSITQPGAEYVEFQAYSSGQNVLAGHSVTFRDATGTKVTPETFGSDVSNGANQMTFVMATPAAEARFGISADAGMTPELIDPTGGAICWESLDCVSWGNYSSKSPLPSPAGPPAAAIPDEQALRRTIAPGCATLLELFDDRNDSSLDFSPVFPSPRPNSVAPSEVPCNSGGGPKGEGGGKKAPETRLKRRPPQRSRDRTPTFRFTSDLADAKFECRIDRKRFRPCRSPLTTRRLSLGRHTFQVRANDPSGPTDQSPATDTFKLVASK